MFNSVFELCITSLNDKPVVFAMRHDRVLYVAFTDISDGFAGDEIGYDSNLFRAVDKKRLAIMFGKDNIIPLKPREKPDHWRRNMPTSFVKVNAVREFLKNPKESLKHPRYPGELSRLLYLVEKHILSDAPLPEEGFTSERWKNYLKLGQDEPAEEVAETVEPDTETRYNGEILYFILEEARVSNALLADIAKHTEAVVHMTRDVVSCSSESNKRLDDLSKQATGIRKAIFGHVVDGINDMTALLGERKDLHVQEIKASLEKEIEKKGREIYSLKRKLQDHMNKLPEPKKPAPWYKFGRK